MADVVLKVVCGRRVTPAGERPVIRCGELWMRWAVDLDRPFDEQLFTSAEGEPYLMPEVRPGIMTTDTRGALYPASDGRWYRWAPGDASDGRWYRPGDAPALPEGETYSRYRLTCPGGHPTDVKARVHKLDDAAVKTLRYLHGTQTPQVFTTTIDKLLAFAV
jgi:hypothetical protein